MLKFASLFVRHFYFYYICNMKKVIDDLLADYTAPIEKRYSLDYQLGVMVGEYIIDNSLPTLSTDALKSMNIIQVSWGLAKKWYSKHDSWAHFKGSDEDRTKLFYENRDWYKKNIEDVYLEDEIKCFIPSIIRPENLEEFGEGVESALWNCDMSHYKYDSYERGKHSAYINLKREK